MQSGNEILAVRRATAADAPGILRCLAAAFAPYRSSYTPGAYLDTVLTPATLAERLQSMHIFVAVRDETRVVGTIACAAAGNREGHLRGMATLPEWQGRGLSVKLLAAAEQDLVACGCTSVTLDTTEPLERAIRFYEKHGYQRSGEVTDFFGMRLHEFRKNL